MNQCFRLPLTFRWVGVWGEMKVIGGREGGVNGVKSYWEDGGDVKGRGTCCTYTACALCDF